MRDVEGPGLETPEGCSVVCLHKQCVDTMPLDSATSALASSLLNKRGGSVATLFSSCTSIIYCPLALPALPPMRVFSPIPLMAPPPHGPSWRHPPFLPSPQLFARMDASQLSVSQSEVDKCHEELCHVGSGLPSCLFSHCVFFTLPQLLLSPHR